MPDDQDTTLRFAALEIDRDGLIVGWSVAAELMFGHSLAELSDRRLSSLLDGDDPARLVQALPEPQARAAFTREVTCRRRNGETFPASLLMTAIDRTDGNAQRLSVLVVDDQRDRNRDRFIASVAHDLHQPISVIEASAFLLEKLERSGAAHKSLARIKRAAAQLHDLATEIVDLGAARLGGDIVLQREHMNLTELLDEICGGLQVTHAERVISIGAADAVSGHWDRKRLRRVAQNLVENALTHSPPATEVLISCGRIRGDVVLTVENECPEQPAAILDDLFQPFRRGSERGRAGLGLYIARELARAHGGDIRVSWDDGHISFTLSLPISLTAREDEPVHHHDASPLFAVQRRHRRLPFDSDLEIGIGDQSFRGRGRDVSPRGLAFWTDVDVKVDERIEVGVSTGPTSFRVQGTVRHVNRQRDRALVGIEFPCDLSQIEIELLKKPLRS